MALTTFEISLNRILPIVRERNVFAHSRRGEEIGAGGIGLHACRLLRHALERVVVGVVGGGEELCIGFFRWTSSIVFLHFIALL
jgi:hypothetical protein